MTAGADRSAAKARASALVAIGIAAALMAIALAYPAAFERQVNGWVGWAIARSEGPYLVGITLIVLTLVAIAVSPMGRIRIGGEHARPQLTTFSWLALIFTSTQGGAIIGLSVYQPLAHLTDPVDVALAAKGMAGALAVTMYTRGFHAWGLWSLLAITVAYFSYNRLGPCSFVGAVSAGLGDSRPKWLDRGLFGSIEVLTLLASWFGLATSLAIICRQISGGIVHLLGLGGAAHQFGPVVAAAGTVLFTLIALSGIGNGLKRVSNLNLFCALALVVLVLLVGNSLDTLGVILAGAFDYLRMVIPFSFDLLASDETSAVSYRRDWGMGFLMWWLVYSSMFAVLFARISYGRTFRTTILATCLIPTIFCLLWFGIMSTTAHQLFGNDAARMAAIDPAITVYDFLRLLFGNDILVWAVLVISTLFLITTGAPAIYVMAELLTGRPNGFSRRMIVLLGGCIGLVLMVAAGVSSFQALQSIAIAISFPFSVVYVATIVLGLVGFLRRHPPISQAEAEARAPEL